MDRAALTKALIEIAARGATETAALTEALGGFLVRTLTETLILPERPARAVAGAVAESFLTGEALDMVILRATATADTLALSEEETRQVERAITATLTSTDVLAPLVARGEGDSALSEAALESVVQTIVELLAPAGTRASAAPPTPSPAPAKLDLLAANPDIGSTYRVIETLASGPHGARYLARALDDGAMVELRVLAGDRSLDEALEQAVREQAARVAVASSHCPAIATVDRCVRTQSGMLVIVTARPEGPTLRETIQREGGLDVAPAVNLAIQIGKALERAHALGLFHGSLSPGNVILVGPDRTVALTQFGIDRVLESRRADAEPGSDLDPDEPAYRAPERASGHAGAPSDVYALGAMLYEMLAGAPPIAGGAPCRRVGPEPLRDGRPDVTPGLDRLIARALQEAPHRRPGISAMCSELWLALSPDEQRRLPYRRTVPIPRSGKRTKQLVACGSLAVSAALAIWFAHGRTSSPTSGGPGPEMSPPIVAAPLDAPAADPPAPPRPAEPLPAPPSAASPSQAKPGAPAAPRAAPAPKLPDQPKAIARGAEPVAPLAAAPARAEAVATTRSLKAPIAPRSASPRQGGEDPSAIIDWLFNERSNRGR